MKTLVEKKQAGDRLSDDDRAWLESANKEVLEKLCK